MNAKNTTPQTVEIDFQTLLDHSSNHRPTMRAVTRLCGPLALRNLLRISAPKMRVLLAQAGYEVYSHQTIYTWERAERDPQNLPRRYWLDRYMPAAAVRAYHKIIEALVIWLSAGRHRAKCTGKRVWHVSLLKAYG